MTIYILNENNFQCVRSTNLSQKVKISGFVDIVDDTIMISDAKTAEVLPI